MTPIASGTDNWLGFIASVVDSVAWPAVLVIILLVIRSPLLDLLKEIKRVSYGDMQIDFGRELQELEDKARNAGLNVKAQPKSSEIMAPDAWRIIAEATQLADTLPGPAIVLAWTSIEYELMQAVMRLAISADSPGYKSVLKNIELLHSEGYIDAETQELLQKLRKLRNVAAHPRQERSAIFSHDAREFVALAQAIIDRLKELKR